MRPPRPWSTMRRAARCAHRNCACRAKRMTQSHSSNSTSRNGVEWPAAALLTSTSRPPSSSASSSITASAPGTSERSTWRCATRTPSASHSVTVSCRFSSSECQVMPRSKPRRARATAVPRPMPEFAPVTMAVGMPRSLPAHGVGYSPPMPDTTYSGTAIGRERAGARAVSTTQLLGQVLFLVAIALGFCALGTWLGRDLALGTARICSFVGFGMLLVSSFAGARLRVGAFAMGWLFATATAIGLGLGPVIAYFATVQESALTQAAADTAATVAGCGALDFALSKDLARWMRPLSLIVFAACVGTIVWALAAGAVSPWVSALIYLLSAALIVVDFNYLRKHGTEDDAIWLATGIFVSIVNIFVSLLNIFQR